MHTVIRTDYENLPDGTIVGLCYNDNRPPVQATYNQRGFHIEGSVFSQLGTPNFFVDDMPSIVIGFIIL